MKEMLTISSSVFQDGEFIPAKYTCDGNNVNPPILITERPKEAISLALIMEDPDAPNGTWVHWVVWNIPPMQEIKENTIPGDEGLNDFGQHHYGGPCPPSGIHRYYFKVYALDTKLMLDPRSKKEDLERTMAGHILAQGEIMGRYAKK